MNEKFVLSFQFSIANLGWEEPGPFKTSRNSTKKLFNHKIFLDKFFGSLGSQKIPDPSNFSKENLVLRLYNIAYISTVLSYVNSFFNHFPEELSYFFEVWNLVMVTVSSSIRVPVGHYCYFSADFLENWKSGNSALLSFKCSRSIKWITWLMCHPLEKLRQMAPIGQLI